MIQDVSCNSKQLYGELTDHTNHIYKPNKTFLNAYSVTEQNINSGEPIFFDTHSAISGNCSHDENTSDIYIYQSGDYHISMSINSVESSQVSLVKNDVEIVPGMTIGIFSGLAQNSLTGIICIVDADLITQGSKGLGCKLQVINNTKYISDITLYGSISMNNIMQQNTAAITIMRL